MAALPPLTGCSRLVMLMLMWQGPTAGPTVRPTVVSGEPQTAHALHRLRLVQELVAREGRGGGKALPAGRPFHTRQQPALPSYSCRPPRG